MSRTLCKPSVFEQMNKDSLADNLRWAFQHSTNYVAGIAVAPFVKQEKRVNAVQVLGVCLLCFFLSTGLLARMYLLIGARSHIL